MSFDPYQYPDVSLRSSESLSRSVLLRWAAVRTALGQMVCGAALMAAGWLCFAVLSLTEGSAFGNDHAAAPRRPNLLPIGNLVGETALMGLALLIFVATSLILVGFMTCCAAPDKQGVRGWIFASVVCAAVCAGIIFMNFLYLQLDRVNLRQGPGKARNIGDVVAKVSPYLMQVSLLASGVCSLLFLRRIAAIAGNAPQQVHVVLFLAVLLSLHIFFLIWNIMDFKVPTLKPIYLALVLVGMAAYTGWYAVLTGCVRAALTSMMLREKEY